MDHPVLTASVLVAGLVLSAFSLWRGRRPSLRVALAVGIALRLFLLVTAAADSWQPLDFAAGFRASGQAILAHRDPVLATHGSWHFLPMIPYLYGLGLRAGLPWEIAGRLVTVAADIALIPLVAKLAGDRNAPGRPVVPLFFLATTPLVVAVGWSDLLNVARYLGGVRPVVGEWGWTAWLTGGNWALAPTAAGIGQVVPVHHPADPLRRRRLVAEPPVVVQELGRRHRPARPRHALGTPPTRRHGRNGDRPPGDSHGRGPVTGREEHLREPTEQLSTLTTVFIIAKIGLLYAYRP
ncbi:hypothetical protein [Actinoallomurus iriomotensis]|uniref:Uncharacterized protein n=1 Tax=Actinoallomurus iriomotensis TaxID=478107 RepID=A0A9W6RTE1_9ACTN|nr:hypothetical protein [Actinoallomurus iriomotensis]GLY79585.1 hypothetical protein Airi01_078520 [Actinoallomurus iriomotensis]